MSPLDRNPGRHVHFSRLDWLRWRAVARLHLLLYAAGWTVQRWRLRLRPCVWMPRWWEWSIVQSYWYRQYKRADRKAFRAEYEDIRLRAALPRRPGQARPATPSAAPERPANPSAGQGTVPVVPAPGTVPVIRAGGVLLPDRPRDTPHAVIDGPVVPRWYREFERRRDLLARVRDGLAAMDDRPEMIP